MTSSSPSIVLFDVMNTLVYDPYAEEIPAFFDLTLDELFERKHPTAWHRFERGELDEQAFYRQYLPDRSRPIDGSALREVLFEAYRWIEGVRPLLEQLSGSNTQLHAFSNYPVWYRIIEQKLELSQFLDWTFVSWHTGVRKPDEAAYDNVLTTLKAPADECLFVDDRPRNCRPAADKGFDTIVFEDADQLADQLRDRELL